MAYNYFITWFILISPFYQYNAYRFKTFTGISFQFYLFPQKWHIRTHWNCTLNTMQYQFRINYYVYIGYSCEIMRPFLMMHQSCHDVGILCHATIIWFLRTLFAEAKIRIDLKGQLNIGFIVMYLILAWQQTNVTMERSIIHPVTTMSYVLQRISLSFNL